MSLIENDAGARERVARMLEHLAEKVRKGSFVYVGVVFQLPGRKDGHLAATGPHETSYLPLIANLNDVIAALERAEAEVPTETEH